MLKKKALFNYDSSEDEEKADAKSLEKSNNNVFQNKM